MKATEIMTKPLTLNPCPVCGSEAGVEHEDAKVVITCKRAGCRMVSAAGLCDAVKMWNGERIQYL